MSSRLVTLKHALVLLPDVHEVASASAAAAVVGAAAADAAKSAAAVTAAVSPSGVDCKPPRWRRH